ncbi:serine/threonine-protein kinase [Kutzneria buriramensis]|uniref:non-specific serine/threonine protein kinase n=1 Tax=Kutzneria buriramensis TaxID=1045776 RepID=A0A3E0GXN4_9PSEU|nr:serine/threonine-protein kinase [Kutzneria buriramensis]REH30672.1 serine/threonine protein kinase [Kutzneria buriramensis]
MSAAPPDVPGHRYVRRLDSGGFADVHVYRQLRPDREVAVKILKDVDLSAQARQQFADEASVMAELTGHENIVRVLSAGELPDGRPYLVMEFYPNGDLRGRLERGPLPVAEVLDIGVRIASAVATAHHENILHRDIKPSNILLDKRGRPALTDFGIASTLAAGSSAPAEHLSLHWAPPEVVRNEPSTKLSDLFSLAATLWHLLAGHSPFEIPGGDNSDGPVMARITTMATPPTGRSDVPQRLERLLQRAMEKDTLARPASAVEFARLLRLVQEEMGSEPTPMSVPDEGPREPVVVAPVAASPTRKASVVVTAAKVQQFLPPDTVARPRRHEEKAQPTMLRSVPVSAEQADGPSERKVPRRWILIGSVAAMTAAGVGGAAVVLTGGGSAPTVVPPANSVQPQQNAGALGENEPPGTPTLVVVRSNPSTLHFSWTYSAQLASDTFRWRTPDGAKSGTTHESSLDISDPAGTKLCVQVKVVRVTGDDGTTDYSPAACGS